MCFSLATTPCGARYGAPKPRKIKRQFSQVAFWLVIVHIIKGSILNTKFSHPFCKLASLKTRIVRIPVNIFKINYSAIQPATISRQFPPLRKECEYKDLKTGEKKRFKSMSQFPVSVSESIKSCYKTQVRIVFYSFLTLDCQYSFWPKLQILF